MAKFWPDGGEMMMNSRKSLLLISVFFVLGVPGCRINPPPDCLQGWTKCEEDGEGGGLYKVCGTDEKWRIVSCGIIQEGSTTRKIGCDSEKNVCASEAKLPTCYERDYYCFDADGELEHGVYIGCANKLLVPFMCSNGGKCIKETKTGLGALNEMMCAEGGSDNSVSCDPQSPPICKNFKYYIDSNKKDQGMREIGLQLNCIDGVWTPSYCPGGNLCDPHSDNGSCQTREEECPECSEDETHCVSMDGAEVQTLIDNNRITPSEDLETCINAGHCNILKVYISPEWTYAYVGTCENNNQKKCERNQQIFPECEIRDGEGFYSLCMEKNPGTGIAETPMPCKMNGNEISVCSEKTLYCAECHANATRCFIDTTTIENVTISYLQKCSEDERWETQNVCNYGCSMNGTNAECNAKPACLDGQKKCEAGKIFTCTDGAWGAAEDCLNSSDCASEFACAECTEGSHRCESLETPIPDTEHPELPDYITTVYTCEDGHWSEGQKSKNSCKLDGTAGDCVNGVYCKNNGPIGTLTVCMNGVIKSSKTCMNESDNEVSCASPFDCGECLNGNKICGFDSISHVYAQMDCDNGKRTIEEVCENGCKGGGSLVCASSDSSSGTPETP